MNKAKNSKKGFTLIELLVAATILGVLASIAVPLFRNYVRNTRAATFSTDIRILANAGAQYSLEAGAWIDTSTPGAFPTELEGYFSERKFKLGSSLGGSWFFDQYDDSDFTSAVGVQGPTHSDDIFVVVDKRIDDGNLSTGIFQKLEADRYYYVIED